MPDTAELTRNQSLVLDRLAGASGPMSAYDILDTLRAEGIKAPLQIYRALDKLLEKGLAHRLESLNAFVACAEPHSHPAGVVAFAICEVCGHVAELSDPALNTRLNALTGAEGFVAKRSTVEIRGHCARCAA
jgi:Fur family transcriptional regulator, zinc uptake regulator